MHQLRSALLVDYEGVAAVKVVILKLLFLDFRSRHIALGTERAAQFQAFVTSGGELLQSHARFDALNQHFRSTLHTPSGWSNWPEAYRDPNSTEVRQFAVTHGDEVKFYAYLQWLAHDQLEGVQALARKLGMPIGLYGDYAVGANPSGSETWVDQSGYCMRAEIGAPPDSLAIRGQGWGVPPPDPWVMETQGIQRFIQLLRANTRPYGALRLDHVMSFCRLWWVAAEHSPADGAYVHYPLQTLFAIAALESSRNDCLVVGEDLGTVPKAIHSAVADYGVYEYKVLLFEKDAFGRFRRPNDFEHRALGTVTIHDTATFRGFWENQDIDLRRRLNLYSSLASRQEAEIERVRDKTELLAALNAQNLQPAQPTSAAEPYTAELSRATHLYLARSTAALVEFQIDDLLGMSDPVNVPGTDREYPNWQRKLSTNLEELKVRPDLAALFIGISHARSNG